MYSSKAQTFFPLSHRLTWSNEAKFHWVDILRVYISNVYFNDVDKIFAKNRTVPVNDIPSLKGLLNKFGDNDLFVTSGTYTSEAEGSARESRRHIKLLDIDNFIGLWQAFYSRLADDEKNMLPLHSIYFLESNE